MKKKVFEGFRKKLLFAFIAAALFIGAFAVFGDKGLLDVYRLRRERDGILSYNRSLEQENKNLEQSIELLKSDKRYIGHIARKELGMIGKNEMVYRFEAKN
ncbi:MAG: septum formation initiator family protein [Deltaproteobacteria bacterium]|nr:septum formation initiator family protein [Deltaproteobacteria bacterium]